MEYETVRTEVLSTAQVMLAHGLTVGDSGNVSARVPGPGRLLLAITPHGQFFDLLSQFGFGQIQEHDVLAVLVGLGLGLVANGIERRRDDFALLPRQLADVLLTAATAAALLGLRLRLLVVLLERPDLHEVDVAR